MSAVLLQQCQQSSRTQAEAAPDLAINLKWYPAYPEESREDVEIGLLWTLSYLGELVNETDYLDYMTWIEDDVIRLDLTNLLDNEERIRRWDRVLAKIRQTSSDRKLRSIDVGKFVFETFTNSENYYYLTEMPETLQSFREHYQLDEDYPYIVAKGESCVSPGYRLFNTSESKRLTKIAYIAQEGTGNSLTDFTPKEFEVFDFMKNGQPRFAVYGIDGELRDGGDSEVTIAGRPAKCMWCHTSQVQPLIFAATDIDGYETTETFSNLIKNQNKIRRRYLRSNDQGYIVDSLRQHSLAELLYVTYEFPTPQRLEAEGLARGQMANLEFHKNIEYKFFDLVFDSMVHRNAIDPNFKVSARETVWAEE